MNNGCNVTVQQCRELFVSLKLYLIFIRCLLGTRVRKETVEGVDDQGSF